MPAGYSGTPLVKKLGIKEGFTVATVDEPGEFRRLLVGSACRLAQGAPEVTQNGTRRWLVLDPFV